MAESQSIIGTLGAAQEEVRLAVAGLGGVAIQVQSTFTGTITFEATVQGQDFTAFRVTPVNSSTPTTTTTTTGLWVGSTVGFLAVRARMSSYGSGRATILMRADVPSPGGAGGGGGTGSDVNLIEVGGAAIALGQAVMAASVPVVMASDQTPIPISGSITASNPSVGPTGDPVPAEATLIGFQEPGGDLSGLALESFDYDIDGGSSQAQTAIGLVIPASGGPVPVGAANPLPVSVAAGSAVIGHVITDTGSTTAVTGNVTVVQPTGTNLHVVTDSGTITTVSTVTSVTAIANALPAGNNNIGDVDVATTNAQSADDAAVAGFPVRTAGAAKSPDGTDPGSVSAENDTANLITDLNRRQFVNTAHPRALHTHLDGPSAYTDQSIAADPGDGFQIIITNIIVGTNAATALNFFLEEGSTKIFGPYGLEAVAGRGFASGPIHLPVTPSTAVTITTSASIAQAIDIDYFIQAV